MIPFRFYQSLYFWSTKFMNSLTLKRHNYFQNQNKRKVVLLPDLWFLSCNRNFKIQWHLRGLELPENWPGDKYFKLWKTKFWERQFFSIVTFKSKYLTFLYSITIYFFSWPIYFFNWIREQPLKTSIKRTPT